MHSSMSLVKRNIYERKIIKFVRTGDISFIFDGSDSRYKWYVDLSIQSLSHMRDISYSSYVEIRNFSSNYLSSFEVNLLRWLAEAQRIAGLKTCDIDDDRLKMEIVNLSFALSNLGISLPYQTLSLFPRGVVAKVERRSARFDRLIPLAAPGGSYPAAASTFVGDPVH